MSIVEALKDLAVAVGAAESATAVTGDSIVEVIQFIAENWPESTQAG